MYLAGHRAMAEQLDTVLTRLHQPGNLLNQIAAKMHGGLDSLLGHQRRTVDILAELVDRFDPPR
jgi:hypothetical protein